MQKYSIAITLNTQKGEGRHSVRVRTTINRVRKFYSTGVTVAPDQFDKGEIVNHPQKVMLNAIIAKKVSEVEKDILEAGLLGQELHKVKKNANILFNDYAAANLERHAGLWSASTNKHKKSYLTKINEFNPRLKLHDMNASMLSKLEDYCRGIGNNANTVWSCSKYVKSVINAAIADGTLDKDPLLGFKGEKYTDPIREVLTQDEITLIEQFADNPMNVAKLTNTAAWFVFGCYSGLRYSDMVGFKGLTDGKILFKTEKTGSIVSIFATEQIKTAIVRLNKPIYSNQKCNEYIGSVCAILGIDKRVTWHTCRHTFAVQWLNRGGSMEVLSKLLGHSTIKTTSIYGKITNLRIDAEVSKVWGGE